MPAKKKPVKKAPIRKRAAAPRRAAAPKSKIPRITYATLALTDKDHAAYDQAVEQLRQNLDKHYSNFINGQECPARDGNEQKHASPADTRLTVSYFPRGTREDTQAAIASARKASVEWMAMPYKERTRIMRRAADLLNQRVYEIAAVMAFEVGKNRAESIAEINESAELIRYYSSQIEENKGYVKPLESPGKGQRTMSVLRPYGVWGVVSPWNFPLALATGMCSGALVAGNAIVYKPASDSPVTGWHL
ncbi:MAG: aldehyde dehydrogenase family protein, partial [Rudaea sp.]